MLTPPAASAPAAIAQTRHPGEKSGLAHRAGCREREQGSADEEVSPPARALQHHRTLMDERSLVSVGFDRVEMRQHGAEVVRREQSMEESGYVTGTSTTSAPPWIRETTRSV